MDKRRRRTPSAGRTRYRLTFYPVTGERWPDMVKLFGERGACAGCWCMWWRGTRAAFESNKGTGNKKRMQRLIDSGVVPGILAYLDKEPIGWCSVGPRETFDALDRSRVLKRIDNEPVWSIVCFFVAKPHRREGISARLLKEAVRYARSQGARIVEGYPVEPGGAYPDAFAYTGFASTFLNAGFTEAARRSSKRSIMRRSC